MSKKPLDISESASVQMPMKTVASLDRSCSNGRLRLYRADFKIGIARDVT